MSNLFQSALEQLNITANDAMLRKFDRYYELLVEWNRVMNLTGITDYEEVNSKHFIDSLSIVNVWDPNDASSLIDVGTGAGFPGIPLKIAFPHLKITLLDSLNKRIRFLNTVIQELDLEEISAIHGRAEEYARNPAYREAYDVCVSRAVANLSTLSEYCLPYLRIGGCFISYKSGEIEEELANSDTAIRLLGGKLENVDKFTLPDTDIHRSLVLIRKKSPTKNKYPRKAGMPAKEPL